MVSGVGLHTHTLTLLTHSSMAPWLITRAKWERKKAKECKALPLLTLIDSLGATLEQQQQQTSAQNKEGESSAKASATGEILLPSLAFEPAIQADMFQFKVCYRVWFKLMVGAAAAAAAVAVVHFLLLFCWFCWLFSTVLAKQTVEKMREKLRQKNMIDLRRKSSSEWVRLNGKWRRAKYDWESVSVSVCVCVYVCSKLDCCLELFADI